MSDRLSVALYTRVSTDLQASRDEGSLDTQEARLRHAVRARGEMDAPVLVFREEGVSGKSLDRPSLQALIEAVKAGKVGRVMVTRVDRLSRSLMDFYELNQLFEKHEVQFQSLNESFDTSSAMGRAMVKLLLVFAELEREQTAERTRAAMHARAARGLWNGGPRPLGYDPAGNGHLNVEPAEAELVRLMFHKYVEFRSAPKLAAWLNDQGHRQKQYLSRRRGATGGLRFSADSVRRVLTNRIYLGEIQHKGETFGGQHDGIVELDLFNRVQAALSDNEKRRTGALSRAHYDYLLTGLVKCSCGFALTPSAGNGHGGRYHYYRCVGLNKKDRHSCVVKQTRAERLDELVMDMVRDAARDPSLVAEAVEEANAMAREMVGPLRQRVDSLRGELREVEQRGEALVAQALSAGIGASNTVRRMLAEAEQRQEQLRDALAAAEGELAVRATEQLDLELVVEAIRGFQAAWEHLALPEKREFLQLMIQEVVVDKDVVEVAFYEGRRVKALLEQSGRVPASPRAVPDVPDRVPDPAGHREQGSQTDRTPGVDQGFATDGEWLRLLDLNQRPSG